MAPLATLRRALATTTAAVAALVLTAGAARADGVGVAGIDVSNYQHPGGTPIDWPQVRAAGIDFAFIKATEGPVACTGGFYTNSWFRRDWREAGAVGLYRGAYHFARPGDVASAIAQAHHFVHVVDRLDGPRVLPPVLDLETTCGLAAPDVVAFARAWLDEVHRLTGRSGIIYTGYYFWKDHVGNDPSFGHLPLWIATYGPAPLVPPVWRGWTFWQHTSTGAVPGIAGAVDLNRFVADAPGLARFAVEGASNPGGSLDLAAGGPNIITVGGWTADPDSPASLDVHVYVDGAFAVAGPAAGHRPDVAAAHPDAGPAHGFHLTVPGVAAGPREVCVYAINVGPGTNALVRCQTVTVG